MIDFSRITSLEFITHMVVLIICITIHEFSHGMSAYLAGDNTPKANNRLSLNPLDHLDPLGTLMMVFSSLSGFGIGWGKPVLVNSFNFRHPRWDMLKVALWGPLSNIITAVVVGLALRFFSQSMSPYVYNFTTMLVDISIWLALFNLIPIPPLDGSKILSSLMPLELARVYDSYMGRYGSFIFLGLIFFAPGVLPALISSPAEALWHLIVGS